MDPFFHQDTYQYILNSREAQMRRTVGAGTTSLRYGLLAYSPHWEEVLQTIPADSPPPGFLDAQDMATGEWYLGLDLFGIGLMGIS